VPATAPYIWLGPGWYAWLMFGPDNRHATFMAIGERVAHELGGAVADLLPNPSDVGKEYAEIVVGEARFLLMRKDPLGISLGVGYPHVPLLLRIAVGFGAECRGWRWPLYRLWRRVVGSR